VGWVGGNGKEESRWEREGEVGRPLKLLGSGNSRHGFDQPLNSRTCQFPIYTRYEFNVGQRENCYIHPSHNKAHQEKKKRSKNNSNTSPEVYTEKSLQD
jgi:hypothetical protein